MEASNNFFDFNIIELLTIIGVGIGTAWAIFRLVLAKWGRFELRFLDPEKQRNPETEKQSVVLRLLPGVSSVIISLRPRLGISMVKRLSFSFFSNRNYPMRAFPGVVSKDRISPTIMKATKLRRENDDGSWGDWHTLKVHSRGSGDDLSFPFVQGSRQVFEVVFDIEDSRIGWDGVFGVEIQYSNGGNANAYVNSKCYVGNSSHVPFTFRFRRVHSTKRMEEVSQD